MFLSFVEPSLVQAHLGSRVVGVHEVLRLLEERAIPPSTPVFLDDRTMLPVEPLNCWFRHLAYEDKDPKTLREYAYIVRRFVAFLHARDGRGLLEATESDLAAYRRSRTELQADPVGDATWGKEAQLLNQLYRWLVEYGWLRHRPMRLTHKGRNPLAPRLRRGMDIRHMTLAQYRYFRDIGLAGQLPTAEADPRFRGRAPLRNRAAADLALCTGMRPEEWSTVLLPELGAGQRRPMTSDRDIRLNRWLEDPDAPIPVHADSGLVNWGLLTAMLGWKRSCTATVFGCNRAAGRERMARFDRAVASGHPTTTGVIDDLAMAGRGDGTTRTWHPGLAPRSIALELRMLRNACYVLVVALSMMRDSEIHEIAPGSIVECFGTPAIKSTKGKHDPNLPVKHWWITAPVAEAIVVAEQLSQRDDRLFPPLVRESAEVARSHQMLDAFIGHVNATSARTGLDPIPHGKSRPHMFRRTMAMLTDQFPGSEIALGIQLKHIASRALANRSTQGYANADDSWAEHLESAVDAARFRRLEDLYRTHKAGEPIGCGPGADRITQAFNHIQQTVQARQGDAAVKRALLHNARLSIRFGVLNHCVMDDSNPAGAMCLENAAIPEGHKGPLQDRCRPDRCSNSVIGLEHIPIWQAEQRTLLTLIETPGLSACRKSVLQRELADVGSVLRKATSTKEPA